MVRAVLHCASYATDFPLSINVLAFAGRESGRANENITKYLQKGFGGGEVQSRQGIESVYIVPALERGSRQYEYHISARYHA